MSLWTNVLVIDYHDYHDWHGVRMFKDLGEQAVDLEELEDSNRVEARWKGHRRTMPTSQERYRTRMNKIPKDSAGPINSYRFHKKVPNLADSSADSS